MKAELYGVKADQADLITAGGAIASREVSKLFAQDSTMKGKFIDLLLENGGRIRLSWRQGKLYGAEIAKTKEPE